MHPLIKKHLSKIGTLGGSVTTPAKSAAARANGTKGGLHKPSCTCFVCKRIKNSRAGKGEKKPENIEQK